MQNDISRWGALASRSDEACRAEPDARRAQMPTKTDGVLVRIAICFALGWLGKAEALYRRGQSKFPDDYAWTKGLARVLLTKQDDVGLAEELGARIRFKM